MNVQKVTATQAARRFAELLDSVERTGETFVIERRGRPVAAISPAPAATGEALRSLLRDHAADEEWAGDLTAVRSLLIEEDRLWAG